MLVVLYLIFAGFFTSKSIQIVRQHGRVFDLGEQAARQGVRWDQPVQTARHFAPQASWSQWDPLDTAPAAIAYQYTPFIQQQTPHRLFLGFPTPAKAYKTFQTLRHQLVPERCWTLLAGGGPSRFLSRLTLERFLNTASSEAIQRFDQQHLDRLWTAQKHPDWLAQQPVTSLWPLDATVIHRLQVLGFRHLGDLAQTPLLTLAQVIGGRTAQRIKHYAAGNDDQPFQSNYPPPGITRSHTFEPAVKHRRIIQRTVRRLTGTLEQMLTEQNQKPARLELRFDFEDGLILREQNDLPRSYGNSLAGPVGQMTQQLLNRTAKTAAAGVETVFLTAGRLSKRQTRQLVLPGLYTGSETGHQQTLITEVKHLQQRFSKQALYFGDEMEKREDPDIHWRETRLSFWDPHRWTG